MRLVTSSATLPENTLAAAMEMAAAPRSSAVSARPRSQALSSTRSDWSASRVAAAVCAWSLTTDAPYPGIVRHSLDAGSQEGAAVFDRVVAGLDQCALGAAGEDARRERSARAAR